MPLSLFPFRSNQLEEVLIKYPSPIYLYLEDGIRGSCRSINEAFSWSTGFRNFFAVKATPNPNIVKIAIEEGCGVDTSSLSELIIAEKLGLRGESIMFTSNDTPPNEFKKARELGAIINLDDLGHIESVTQNGGLPEIISFRYNPGDLRTGNSIIGEPKESKFGVTRDQLFSGYRICKEKGIKRFGIHTMVATNELDPNYFVETARMLFDLVVEISKSLGIRFELINLGGGIGIPQLPEQKPIDLKDLGIRIKNVYEDTIVKAGLAPIRISMECGRVITGPYGFLITRVLHVKESYKRYIGIDACSANLMRPAMYGAYHHITVLGKDGGKKTKYDVVGSLCENNDKFAIDRELPEVSVGDVLVIHDVGAHGHAMGYNYNGKLRSAELLMSKDGSVRLIRRAETIDDYLGTVVA